MTELPGVQSEETPRSVETPYDVNDENMYVKGFREYEGMCVGCHGAPGVEPSPTGRGLFPKPPRFPEEELHEYALEDIFWVVKNGIKMTGMPAYGPRTVIKDDREIYPAEYRELKDASLTPPRRWRSHKKIDKPGCEHELW